VFVSCSLGGVRNPVYAGVIERWSSKTLEIPKLSCSSNTTLYILVIFLVFLGTFLASVAVTTIFN
jgi:hypothetical protein